MKQMAFYKLTLNQKYNFATVYNYGCTFKCPVCSYKLRSGLNGRPGHAFPRPDLFPTLAEFKNVLAGLAIDQVFFMGGEPTVAPDLPELLRFAKHDLKIKTLLGHTNGSRLPIADLDMANVGFKAWNKQLHLKFTGKPKSLIYVNFKAAFRSGMTMKANAILIPGLVEIEQIAAIAQWLGKLSPEIPLHINGYIPVPGQPFKKPSDMAVANVVDACREYLNNVNSSNISPETAIGLAERDDRFDSIRII
jgi:pyruvate formate lyase activating enzyme